MTSASKKGSGIISAYLQSYADAHPGDYPEPSSEIIEFLRRNPAASFDIIVNNAFQTPGNLDPRDLGDPLCRLLAGFADLVPDLLIPKMTDGFWASRYLYISSAAASKSPTFIPTIINLLTDRSIYIKSLVLHLIIQWPHLQVPEALPLFDKLSKQKTFQNSEIDRSLLIQAKQCVSASHQGQII